MAVNRSEEAEQARVVMWSHKKKVRDVIPALKWLYHTPNGGLRNVVVAMQMKAMGVKTGVPDLLLPVRTSKANGLAIEMKSDIGVVSPEQSEWLTHYQEQGWMVQICRSATEAHATLCDYFEIDAIELPLGIK